ncbi:MAG TPA: AMIN domain-containing protein [Candidatus Sulfotelmatobacter sp.]|nr:AMIN domain-containing protein [Candidatus Sulfotelmatobacter sp.]
MPTPRGKTLGLFLLAGILAAVAASPATLGQSSVPSVRTVHVLDSKNAVEIEVEASDRLAPQTRVLTDPDRLVVDFPNALPGNAVRNQVINRGEVKSVRVGLFQSSPPVTRIVLDLKTAQSFQIFPYGRSVIIKITGGATKAPSNNAAVEVDDFPPAIRPGLLNASFGTGGERVQPQGPGQPAIKAPLEVTFRDGMLTIRANKASLSEILFAVHQRTGAEVAVAAGAEAEQVVAEYGPGPAPEVLARLLNGSRFNFLIVSSPSNPQKLDRVILSVRGDSSTMPLPPIQSAEEVEAEPPVAANTPNDPASANAEPPAPPRNQQEMRPNDNTPN